MNELKTYFTAVRVIAAVAISVVGLLQAIYHPGTFDLLNGAATGLVLYALWRT